MNNLLTFPKIKKTDFILFYVFLAFAFLYTGSLSAQDDDTELSKSEIKEFVENASQRLILFSESLIWEGIKRY